MSPRAGLPSTANRQTTCTVCKRTVGVARNWARQEAGQGEEYRVSRHFRASTRQYCVGGGILIDEDSVSRVIDSPRPEVPSETVNRPSGANRG